MPEVSFGRRRFLRAGGAAPLLAAGCSPKAQKPNLLVILTDQQHIDTIAARGAKYLRTPALDELALRATSFSLSYCPNPVSSPSRSAILTGRMPSETGVATNNLSIRETIPNLGQWFAENSDYETFYAGKWHLPRSYQKVIPGFHTLPGGIGGQGNVGDAAVSRASEDFLRLRVGRRPFLLIASFLQPHDICEWLRLNLKDPGRLRYPEIASELPPLPDNFLFDASEPALLRRRREANEPALGQWSAEHWRYYLWSYYRHVEMVDGEIGRILRAVADTRRLNNTVVVFTSDHGEGMARHQTVRKSTSYDEASRVPLLISWPGVFPADAQDATNLVSGIDLVPTLCDCAGIDPPPGVVGRSLRPLLEGKVSWPGRFVVTEIDPNAGRLVRTRRYKYVTFAGDPVEQLFDMEADPGETTNLAGDSRFASILRDHRKLLQDWQARLWPAPNLPNAASFSAVGGERSWENP
jgi:arylsulfatase A-like enzyme